MHLRHSFLNRVASSCHHHHAEEQAAPDEMVSPLHGMNVLRAFEYYEHLLSFTDWRALILHKPDIVRSTSQWIKFWGQARKYDTSRPLSLFDAFIS